MKLNLKLKQKIFKPSFYLLSLCTGLISLETIAEENQLSASNKTVIDSYEERIARLENASKSNTSFNPQISVILDGQFSVYDNHAEDYELPGFVVGGEAGLKREGFSLGHSELSMSANVDDKFYGKLTLAIADHEGETELELEEAFAQTTALPYGLSLRTGRFFASLGYLNQQHEHAWDFADAPLVYRALWGNKYLDDGVRLSWIPATDLYFELGAEAFSGAAFPAGGEASSNVGSQVYFMNTGADFNESHSWQAGLSFHKANVEAREAAAHSHGAAAVVETPSFTGDSQTQGVNAIYKWAPNGNYKNRHFKLQAEYFIREEEGDVILLDSSPLEKSDVDSEQKGFYVQGIYQFMPQWRFGLRYDQLESDASGSDDDVLEEAGLDNEGVSPKQKSLMLEWLPSEFSRVRFQYNVDDSYEESDKAFFLQYTMSLGAHGAHTY